MRSMMEGDDGAAKEEDRGGEEEDENGYSRGSHLDSTKLVRAFSRKIGRHKIEEERREKREDKRERRRG